MASIDVGATDETERRFTVTIGTDDGSSSTHTIGVSDADWDRFGGGFEERADLVEASVVFLLEREPKESILRSFELGDIGRYFPEYGESFTGRASG
jgi:hypothetical protein